jgi:hypothetical protein
MQYVGICDDLLEGESYVHHLCMHMCTCMRMHAHTHSKPGMSESLQCNSVGEIKVPGPKFLGSIIDLKKICHVLPCLPSFYNCLCILGFLN